MTTAELCCLCKNRRMLTLLWRCWWWKEWDNGHDNKGEIFIFDDGFKMAYQCVCEMLAWLAMNGVIVNVENIMTASIELTCFDFLQFVIIIFEIYWHSHFKFAKQQNRQFFCIIVPWKFFALWFYGHFLRPTIKLYSKLNPL